MNVLKRVTRTAQRSWRCHLNAIIYFNTVRINLAMLQQSVAYVKCYYRASVCHQMLVDDDSTFKCNIYEYNICIYMHQIGIEMLKMLM